MTTLAQVTQLTKQYPDSGVLAVDQVSFEIQSGEVFSLLGPNGAGKSTTISMLSCLLQPTSGDATIAGHSVVTNPMHVKNLIGVVPQEIALYETLSARDNLLFWGRMYGMGGSALKTRVDEVLDQVGLSERAKDKIATYSGGMKRRINIAVGLLHKPQLVFMDEPTVGIDPQSRRRILDMVKELNQQGLTVLYTTHYMEEAEELSDRVGIIDHGKLIALGTQKELTRMVGENEGLRLHFAEGDVIDPLVESLRTLPSIIQVSTTDHEILVIVPEAEEALPAVIGQANRAGINVRSIDIEEPNLEAVFLHLTGRALRD
ncbi:MAG: ATP-binding cassette domain-containing protein [Anaerolineales bacterium]|nr:ATP-binding cassette domain-containing protein [Anaerolineales bacterium]